MTGIERKPQWRLANPERSREAERQRAKARRSGAWKLELGSPPVLCNSSESYWRYEHGARRMHQRFNWPRIGPGSMRMTTAERRAIFRARVVKAEADAKAAWAELDSFVAALGAR